jgi:hypothetical protein
LTDDDMQAIQEGASRITTQGARNTEANQRWIDR